MPYPAKMQMAHLVVDVMLVVDPTNAMTVLRRKLELSIVPTTRT